MTRYYIEKLVVSGGEHKPSVLELKPGLNFVIGPSNTGKSLILDCVDYAFGLEPKKDRPSRIVDNSFGYTCITLHLQTGNGTVVLEREIGSSKITVSGTDPDYEHGTYGVNGRTKKPVNAIFLQLLGINEPHEVQQSLAGKKQMLSWRSMLNIFLIKQGDVARETSILLNKSFPSATPSQAILLFLMSGIDANELVKPESKEIRDAKKAAVMVYIQEKVKRLTDRADELQELALSEAEPDMNAAVSAIMSEIDEVQTRISLSVEKSKTLMDKIYEQNSKLTECDTIAARFTILRRQYESDIERLGFVVEGELSQKGAPVHRRCPFCDNEITAAGSTSYMEATKAELSHIKTHLTELETAQKDLERRRGEIRKTVAALEREKDGVDALVVNQLRPRVAALKDKLGNYRRAIQLNSEMEIIRSEQRQYSSELYEHETADKEKEARFDIVGRFDRTEITAYEDMLISILKASKIGGYGSARLNMNTFDVEINGYGKAATMGGGYCGILNTIVALAMTKYLQNNDKFAPGFFLVDSSLTQLSESEHKESANTIKVNFINYLIAHATENQTIIVEQTKRLPFILAEDEKKGVHVIEFTGEVDNKRYGFLNDVKNVE